MRELYLGLLTEDEYQSLLGQTVDGHRHPLVALVSAMQGDRPDSAGYRAGWNTLNAVRRIAAANRQWLLQAKRRVLEHKDFADPAAALGEIRAYGDLLAAEFDVKPFIGTTSKGSRPEFLVTCEGKPVVVEVHTKQMDNIERKRVHDDLKAQQEKAIAQAKRDRPSKSVLVTTASTDVATLGRPDAKKVGDSLLTNKISRFCSIKQNEKQREAGTPFVVWMDLQDGETWIFENPEELEPAYVSGSRMSLLPGVMAGAIWWALYGLKGDPLPAYSAYQAQPSRMLHEGRFALSNKCSAVVTSMPRVTALFEHPAPLDPLPKGFRQQCLGLWCFDVNRSVMEFEPGLVNETVRLSKQRSRAIFSATQALLETI